MPPDAAVELDDELWGAFFSEADEHLDALERLLSAGSLQGAEIGAAFRAMHSLKGLSQAVGLPNMQVLTHHSEDLLGAVRSGNLALDGALVGVLLAVTDRLRGMREWVQQHGTDAPQDGALAAELDRAVQALATPAAEPAIHAPPPPAPLAEDGEMLAMYSELLEESAADLACLLSADAAQRTPGHDQAEALANGAEVLGFEQLRSDLLDLASPGVKSLPALSALAGQLSLIEEMTGVAAGAARLGAALAEAASAEAGPRLAALRGVLTHAAELAAVLPLARSARAALEAAGRQASARQMLLLEEALAGAPEAGKEAEAVRQRCLVLLDQAAAGGERDPGAAVIPVPAPDIAGPVSRLKLRPELLAVLTPALASRVEDQLAAGLHAYTLLLDLDGGETAADVVAWLSSTEVVTNCTVSDASGWGGMTPPPGRSWFEFLILSGAPPEMLQAELLALDPERLCVHGLRHVSGSGAAAADLGLPAGPSVASPVIRVRVDTIDQLMDEVGELRVALGALGEAMRGGGLGAGLRALRRDAERSRDVPELVARLREAERGHAALMELQERLQHLQRQVWNRCMELRVVPADSLFGRFPRLVRDLVQTLGKPAELELRGREVRLDKSMADLLVDPLMHMLRNALDHGVEPMAIRRAAGKPDRAHLVLSAAEQGDGIVVSVEDDGAGLDRATILARAVERGLTDEQGAAGLSDRDVFDFLFRPGFSTAAQVTEISGRGVGLDVVAAVVERLDGRIDLETQAGRGTRFILSLPSSASLQNVLLVQVPQTVALAEREVVAVLSMADAVIDRVQRRAMLWFEEAPIPLVCLGSLLGLAGPAPPTAETSVVVVSAGRERLALSVDAVPLRRELFLKELHPLLAQLPAVAGGAVLGDGKPVLVLDVAGLVGLANAQLADG